MCQSAGGRGSDGGFSLGAETLICLVEVEDLKDGAVVAMLPLRTLAGGVGKIELSEKVVLASSSSLGGFSSSASPKVNREGL